MINNKPSFYRVEVWLIRAVPQLPLDASRHAMCWASACIACIADHVGNLGTLWVRFVFEGILDFELDVSEKQIPSFWVSCLAPFHDVNAAELVGQLEQVPVGKQHCVESPSCKGTFSSVRISRCTCVSWKQNFNHQRPNMSWAWLGGVATTIKPCSPTLGSLFVDLWSSLKIWCSDAISTEWLATSNPTNSEAGFTYASSTYADLLLP